MNTETKLKAIIDAAEEIKAEQIETLDVAAKTSIADYFVVCTGTSDRHADSIADKIIEKLKEQQERPLRSEGERTGWVLLDYGDIVVHVMRDEQRQFYDIETLWKEAKPEASFLQGAKLDSAGEA